MHAIAALEALPRGDYLRLRHRMRPCHLYAVLQKNGLAWDTRHGEVVECELFIWHAGDEGAAAAVSVAAAPLIPWQD